MPIDTSQTVESIATSNAASARHLVRLGIDAQAQGRLSLDAACQAQGLDTAQVAAGLESLKPAVQKDWMRATLPELVHHIIHHHHTFTREELKRLGTILDRAVLEPGPDQAVLARVKVHFAALAKDLVDHFQMEERNLFPAICSAENGGITPISLSTPTEQARTISAEHQAAEELFHNIRILTADYDIPAGAVADLRAFYIGLRNLEDDLHLHLFLENHILFPRALPH